MAICGATEIDQLDEVVDLAYKLRHSSNTADMLPSTEYALTRILVDHDRMDLLFKVIGDPVTFSFRLFFYTF